LAIGRVLRSGAGLKMLLAECLPKRIGRILDTPPDNFLYTKTRNVRHDRHIIVSTKERFPPMVICAISSVSGCFSRPTFYLYYKRTDQSQFRGISTLPQGASKSILRRISLKVFNASVPFFSRTSMR
jgi:hypothetical protein